MHTQRKKDISGWRGRDLERLYRETWVVEMLFGYIEGSFMIEEQNRKPPSLSMQSALKLIGFWLAATKQASLDSS